MTTANKYIVGHLLACDHIHVIIAAIVVVGRRLQPPQSPPSPSALPSPYVHGCECNWKPLLAASSHTRYGPHFEDVPTIGNVTNITVPIGNAVYLNCRISLLQDKTVRIYMFHDSCLFFLLLMLLLNLSLVGFISLAFCTPFQIHCLFC